MMSSQDQRAGDNSTNIQAGEVVVNQGLSYSDAKQVALDVFRANFYQLAGKAAEVARLRAEEITDEFLKKLQSENPTGFAKAEDPSFQHALFTVQKEYAKTGDRELGDLLVDLLVDRSKQDKRNLKQIVLTESLHTAPKLTGEQLSVLAVAFLFKYTVSHGIGTHQILGEHLDKHVMPFSQNLSGSQSCYSHLQYSGCGSVGMGQLMLEDVLRKSYQGLFLKGHTPEELASQGIGPELTYRFFVKCLNDPARLQVKALNTEGLGKLPELATLNVEDKKKIFAIFDQHGMTDEEVRAVCVGIRPYMDNVFSLWSESAMKNFTLTSVGMAIGHANIKRLVGEFADLSIWIN